MRIGITYGKKFFTPLPSILLFLIKPTCTQVGISHFSEPWMCLVERFLKWVSVILPCSKCLTTLDVGVCYFTALASNLLPQIEQVLMRIGITYGKKFFTPLPSILLFLIKPTWTQVGISHFSEPWMCLVERFLKWVSVILPCSKCLTTLDVGVCYFTAQ